ncbi:MAG: NAD-dependent epimerase/dehydratase family protein [Anaerolineae bacterium]|nr:MAG: NAD-dependent epimerase/dehydratase family protein [Anaerolineae bacterium]
MNLVIFGASGRTGRPLVEQALAAGHTVTAFTRAAHRLGFQHDRLHIVEGDIRDAEAVNRAVQGAQAVLSVLGPASNTPEFAVSAGTQVIIAAMRGHGVQRLVASAGAGVSMEKDQPRAFHRLMDFLVSRLSRYVFEDMVQTVAAIRRSDLDWTVVRVPMLVDGESLPVKVGYVGRGPGPRLTRGSLAAFMLQQADDLTYRHDLPVISN